MISEGYETLKEGIERLIENNEQTMNSIMRFFSPERYEFIREINEHLRVILVAGKAAEKDRRNT